VSGLVSEVLSRPLELHRPPWELHVIGGLDHGRVAVLAKLHHALCDGAGAIRLGMRLLQDDADTDQDAAAMESPPPRPSGPFPAPPLGSRWLVRAGQVLDTAALALDTVADVLEDPLAAARQTQASLMLGTRITAALVSKVRLPAPRSPIVTRLPQETACHVG